MHIRVQANRRIRRLTILLRATQACMNSMRDDPPIYKIHCARAISRAAHINWLDDQQLVRLSRRLRAAGYKGPIEGRGFLDNKGRTIH